MEWDLREIQCMLLLFVCWPLPTDASRQWWVTLRRFLILSHDIYVVTTSTLWLDKHLMFIEWHANITVVIELNTGRTGCQFVVSPPCYSDSKHIEPEPRGRQFVGDNLKYVQVLYFDLNFSEFFLRVQLTISLHWFRQWLCAKTHDKPSSGKILTRIREDL